jgi:3-dehydroquinate synthetase
MLTATALSAELGMVPVAHAERLFSLLRPWHDPYANRLVAVGRDALLQALARDKKNSATGLTCILTRGFGAMERMTLTSEQVTELVWPTIGRLIDSRFSGGIMGEVSRVGLGSTPA